MARDLELYEKIILKDQEFPIQLIVNKCHSKGRYFAKGYQEGLSIEPHSRNWRGELGDKGVDYTIGFIRKLMLSKKHKRLHCSNGKERREMPTVSLFFGIFYFKLLRCNAFNWMKQEKPDAIARVMSKLYHTGLSSKLDKRNYP